MDVIIVSMYVKVKKAELKILTLPTGQVCTLLLQCLYQMPMHTYYQ